jgi:hypothetical protein
MLIKVQEKELGYSSYHFYEYPEPDQPFTGIAYETYPNGQIKSDKSYFKGIQKGFEREWYSNGQLEHECGMEAGVADIFYKEWYINGQLKGDEIYENGIGIINKVWDEKGNLLSEEYLEQDKSSFAYKMLEQRRKYPTHTKSIEEVQFEQEINNYLLKYPSSRVYYEKDFI